MADNCHMLGGWPFHAAFPDGFWVSDAMTHETETLTRALQLSVSTDTDVLAAATGCSPFLSKPEPAARGPAADAEARSRHLPPSHPATGKISKRKSRASRQSATTFIAADPAHFRQMVQQVTGARPGPAAEAAVLRPEPWRAGWLVDCLPTLDTSAYLLGGGGATAKGASGGPSRPGSHAELGFRGAGLDAELPVPRFPTLESWAAM